MRLPFRNRQRLVVTLPSGAADAPTIPPANATAPQAVDAAAQVGLAYRTVLRRQADSDGLARYTAALQDGRDMAWLVGVLADSDEFRAALPTAEIPPVPESRLYPLDAAPPMAVQTECGADELQALWDRVAAVWSGLGEADAHWSVLTEDRFRASSLDAAALAAFHETGEGEARRLDAWLHRSGVLLPADGVCAEYGCGVGRITRALAGRFRRVLAFDVSASHLHAATADLAASEIGNVELLQVRGPADLAALDGMDLFYSVISLQHSPPPVIMDVLRRAFAGLRPGGCAFFQVPTYGASYAWPSEAARQVGMEMHFVPQRTILAAAHDAGLRVLEVQPDWCVGRDGEWISNTFLLRKG
ncbi:MAG: class I SAM-dependent methyltransferase [Janthinobacterium lividum]